jgi:hypothetical protein
MVPVITKDLTDWTAKNRVRAAQVLQSVIIYAEESITPYLPKILDTLVTACTDDDPTIASIVMHIASSLMV